MIVIGIDVGGSTTKICGFDSNRNLIKPLCVKAGDPIASVYGAFGKFTQQNSISLSDIEVVNITGVGASYIEGNLYGIQTKRVEEFSSIGLGGLYLSGLEKAIVVSMGTGTATVMADSENDEIRYLGGTGVGGGTLIGLSKKMLGVQDIAIISELAESGDLANVDLRIMDITRDKAMPSLDSDLTASNFGKLSDIASTGDIALGIINLVFETIGMISIFAARNFDIKDIVLTGNLVSISQSKQIFDSLSGLFNVKFISPELGEFGTVIGAALSYYKK